MLPHAGEDTRVFREVAELGAILAAHPEISSYETDKASVAMVFDYEQIWAMMQANMPTDDLSYPDTVASWYRALYKEGIKVDFVPADTDLETLKGYKLVLMPMVHMLSESEEKTFTDYATDGGNLVVGYFSNITDRTLRVKLGGYGGNLVKDVIGVYVEEYYPLREASIKLSNGFNAKLWSELSRLNGAEAIASFEGGDAKGSVALAKRNLGSSTAWYQGTELDDDSQRKFFGGICQELGIQSAGGEHLEITKRGPFTFEIDNANNTFEVKRG
jgi:beta-galactosidase